MHLLIYTALNYTCLDKLINNFHLYKLFQLIKSQTAGFMGDVKTLSMIFK